MWIALALLTAVCAAFRDLASKHATRRADPVLVGFGVAAVPALSLVALLYSVSATYDKVGTRASTPLAWAAAIPRRGRLHRRGLLGHSVFREQHVRQRLVGAAVMLAGFLLVTLS